MKKLLTAFFCLAAAGAALADPGFPGPQERCAGCEMFAARTPGAKGCALLTDGRLAYWCSVRCMLRTWPSGARQAWVSDMAGVPWREPAKARFVPAGSASFVADSDVRAPMGPAVATFGERSAAQAFVAQHGGRIETLSTLRGGH